MSVNTNLVLLAWMERQYYLGSSLFEMTVVRTGVTALTGEQRCQSVTHCVKYCPTE